jgi:ATP-binding cassette subfamily C protein
VAEVTEGIEPDFEGMECDRLTFAYGEEKILDDFSLAIKKNRITGITGRSGSGKSTLLKLLMRFWDTDRGRVLLSGEDIKMVNTRRLRELQGYMTQETQLFDDTLLGNIRIAKADASPAEVEAACRKASLHGFVASLPDGYQTPVGELGARLSGGEKQRIGLARAFLHDSPLILLDEPTSSLDSLNEAVILKSLYETGGGKTVVLVSHRKSTMRVADEVYSAGGSRPLDMAE